MQKTLLSIVLVLYSTFGYGQKPVKIELQTNENKFEVTNVSETSFSIQNAITTLNLQPVSTQEGNFMSLESQGLVKIYNEGVPNIPVVSKLIEIPQDAEVEFNILSFDEELIRLSDYGITNRIAPATRSQSKSEEANNYIKNEAVYNTDSYTNEEIITYEASGQLRASRLGRLIINPIQYNPVKNTLRVLNNLVIDVNFTNANFEKTNALKSKYSTSFFDNIISNSTINYRLASGTELVTQAPTHLVIVSDRMFEAQLAPFIAWKIKKGFKVSVGYTDDIGATTTEIKSYLEAIYNGDTPMSYVLFVGDIQQVPAWSGSAGSHVTDLRYCEYTGDNLPEVYYGRFSAQNTAQLQPQIDKTLMYEQFTMADPSYLSEVFLVAGDDASHEMTWGNGQLQYGEDNYFNASNNVNPHTYLQPLDNAAVRVAGHHPVLAYQM